MQTNSTQQNNYEQPNTTGCWKNKSAKGTNYFSLKCPHCLSPLVMFENLKKINDKAPDYQVLISNKKEQQK